MAKKKKKQNNALKAVKIILTVLLVLIVLVGIAFGVFYGIYSNKNQDSISGFALTHGGELLPSKLEVADNNYRVDVPVSKFEVEILPCDVEFDFTHNGTTTKFPYIEGDWSKAFDVKIYDGYFTFDNSNRNILSVIKQAVYPSEHIEAEETDIDAQATYFVLRVKIGENNYDTNLVGWYAMSIDIQLDKTEVVF